MPADQNTPPKAALDPTATGSGRPTAPASAGDRLPQHPLRMADLANNRDHVFALGPTEAERQAVADVLGILGVRKLTMAGRLSPLGRSDWRLEATLGATVVQECVVSLDPVATRIDEPVMRTYRADMAVPAAGEIEMPEDDTEEGLPGTLDLAAVMIEALALSLPPYPRRPDAAIGELVVTEPGKTPLTQSQMRPFAGLAALRDKLAGEDDTPE